MMNTMNKKPRLAAIEYIRGVSMLGVIGIHVGSQYLMNPSANIHLVALFETVTRFAVPIFFFISAFGLFYNLDTSKPFDYPAFLKRRFKAVLIPYLFWSALYILHDTLYYNFGLPPLGYLLKLFFFGLAKYHLYFLVILLWFYLLMPIWIVIVRSVSVSKLLLLLVVQTVFDYVSSYSSTLSAFTYSLPEDSPLRWLLEYRLNYLVLHYVFIFVLGGYLAVHSKEFLKFMQRHRPAITLTFLLSLAALLCHYYFLILVWHLPSEAAVNTAHQLSPIGIIYTMAASVFFFSLFTFTLTDSPLLRLLGRHSYFIYLFHPFVILYLHSLLDKLNLVLTAPNAIIFYFLTATVSLIVAVLVRTLGKRYTHLNELTIGSKV